MVCQQVFSESFKFLFKGEIVGDLWEMWVYFEQFWGTDEKGAAASRYMYILLRSGSVGPSL